MSHPYRGPLLVATADEAALVAGLLREADRDDEQIVTGLRAKCEAVLASDPRWKQPLR